jgi:membrane peptidoglycan carboxypeptidase
VRLLDLTAAYAALGASGELAEPFAVVRVRDREGRIVYERHAATPRRVLSRQHAYLLADILSDARARVPTFGYGTPFELPFAAAVKSGTTTGFRDNWTVGYTPDVAVGVWVGNADASPMQNLSGVDGAAPIWRDVMVASSLGRSMSPFVRPAGIVEVTVCAPTGLLPGADCPTPVREVFVAGTEPTARETYYVRAADGALAIDPDLEARAWAREAGVRLATDAPPSARETVRIVAPEPGSVFYLAPELVVQHLLLRAAAAPGVERVVFEVDGALVGEVPAGEAWLVWALEPGTHTVVARAALAGGWFASAPVTFEVRP